MSGRMIHRWGLIVLYNIHVRWLAWKAGVRVWIDPTRHFEQGLALWASPTVKIAPIRGPLSYITALHEIGHSQDRTISRQEAKAIYDSLWTSDKTSPSTVVELCECLANGWVIRYAIHITPPMKRYLHVCFSTYNRLRPERLP